MRSCARSWNFKPYPAGQGLAYSLPSAPRDYVETLGAGLTLFLAEKQILPVAQAIVPAGPADRLGGAAAQSEIASLLLLGLHARARRLGIAESAVAGGPWPARLSWSKSGRPCRCDAAASGRREVAL